MQSMGLLKKENKNTLVDLSDMIDPDSIEAGCTMY